MSLIQGVSHAWPLKSIPLFEHTPQQTFDTPIAAENYTAHQSTGVDKLHEQGIYGKGVKVAIVDTGIDYNHPALGGGFGSGFKVAGGYDYVGDGGRHLSLSCGHQSLPADSRRLALQSQAAR